MKELTLINIQNCSSTQLLVHCLGFLAHTKSVWLSFTALTNIPLKNRMLKSLENRVVSKKKKKKHR